MENKYPIGGYAPGNYQRRCSTCNFSFFGDKRAVQCEPCAMKDKEQFDALSPEKQQEMLKRNATIARHILFKGGMPPLEELILSDEDMKAWEKDQAVKLTPEQIEERKKAIEWYRNPGAEQEATP